MEQITKNKIIYSKKIVLKLLEMGFIPVEQFPNPFNPQYTCWAFEWTQEFDDALNVVLGGARNGSS